MIDRKFKATEKHELLDNWVEFYFDKSEGKILVGGFKWAFHIDNINDWLKKGWIVEVYDPEFTIEQMLDFGNFIYNSELDDFEDIESALDSFINPKKGPKRT